MRCTSARAAAALALATLLLGGCAGPAPRATRAPEVAGAPVLPPPAAARSWAEFKIAAARRMVQANPGISYLGRPPEPLLGIPVIEIELDVQGRVRSTRVLREPAEARQVTAIALAAIRRAAPYGDMSHLPPPWKFVEVFLFDAAEHFKPATLDR